MANSTDAAKTSLFFLNGGNSSSYNLEYKSPSILRKEGEVETIMVPYIEIGRSNKCNIQFGDEYQTVSRRHAAIEKRDKTYVLLHLSSTNPTMVNGQTIMKEHVLQDGDEIQLAMNGPLLKFSMAAPVSQPSTGFTTRINMVTQQAVKPYRTIVYVLIAVLVLSIAAGGYFIWQQQQKLQASNEQFAILEKQRQEDQAAAQKRVEEITKRFSDMKSDEAALKSELNKANSVISEQSTRIGGLQQQQIDDKPMSTVDMYQKFKGNIYFLEVMDMSVTMKDGSVIPVNRKWTGSAFLCSDGRLVTARHCIQGWRYGYDSTSLLMNVAENAGAKINVRYRVTSSTNDSFEFSYANVTLDDRNDKIQTVNEFKLRFPTDDASDWAYIDTKKSSNIVYDKNLSTGLKAGENLFILGFSLAIGGPNDGEIKPLYSKSDVAQDGLSPDGLILVTNRNFEQGNSGGPVFSYRDGNYKCVGIISIARIDSHGGFSTIGGIVPISRIQ